MSVSRPGADRQPLLPATVEHSLNELAIRIAGGVLVAFAVSSWLALLSWQMRDGATRASRNLLGAMGANLADMLVHSLGIAVVFALICPMVWGMELLAGVRWITRFRLRVVAATAGTLMLAGAASGLPALPGWPLHGGAGGMLGDLVHHLALAIVGRGTAEREAWIVLPALAIVGLWLVAHALGYGGGQLLGLAWQAIRQGAGKVSGVSADAPAATGTAAPLATPSTALDIEPRAPVAPEAAPAAARPAPAHAVAAPARAETDADAGEEEAARAFAERFAPGVAAGPSGDRKRLVPALKETLARARAAQAAYRRPSLNLLRRNADHRRREVDVVAGAAALIEVLGAFGVKGEIREAATGPVVTRYELEPVRGTKLARVIGLADDFARELGVASVRVSVTPGRTTIGLEVPNETRESVALRDILESDTFAANPAELPLALGKGIAGEPIVLDLARMPHLLVAGTTGSGKSVGLNAMIVSLLYRHEPSDLRLLLIDPKMLEMAQYDRIPHLLSPVITDAGEAARALEWAAAEMDERYRRMALHGARNIEGFNSKVRNARTTGVALTRNVQTGFDPATGRAIYERQQLDAEPMPYIVIVIDELADLMVTAGRRVEAAVQRLAQKARAAGIHLIMATQRPSVDVVTGTIKANFPVRIGFRVASKIDSRTIINEPGAEQLLGQGDMLLVAGPTSHMRVHGAYVADEEIERVTEALRDQGEPRYVDLSVPPVRTAEPVSIVVASHQDAHPAAADRQTEAAYAAAVQTVAGDRKASAGHLHRRLGMPMPLAEQMIARMEAEGIVGAPNMLGRRQIHIAAPALTRAPTRSAA